MNFLNLMAAASLNNSVMRPAITKALGALGLDDM